MNTAVQDFRARRIMTGRVTMNPDEVYRNPMSIALTFKYVMPGDKVEDLYKRAKQNQWDSDEYLPWDTEIGSIQAAADDRLIDVPSHCRSSETVPDPAGSLYRTFNGVADEPFLHRRAGSGHDGCLRDHSVPDINAKLYAATQTMDEARHVEVFAKYCEGGDRLSDGQGSEGRDRCHAQVRPVRRS